VCLEAISSFKSGNESFDFSSFWSFVRNYLRVSCELHLETAESERVKVEYVKVEWESDVAGEETEQRKYHPANFQRNRRQNFGTRMCKLKMYVPLLTEP